MEAVTPVLEEKERSATYKPVFVTEITDDLHFYVQDVETGECPGPAQASLPPSSWRGHGLGAPGISSAAHPPGPVPLSGPTGHFLTCR